jgi:hypothetical protein
MKNVLSKLLIMSLFFAFITSYGQNKRSLNNYKEPSKEGVNVFEAPKDTSVVKAFEGVTVRVGGSSTLQFQAIDHSNGYVDAGSDETSPWFDELPLIEIGNNFNLATANLDLDVAFGDGLRMHLRTYLSSRHHPEPYVKGGYLQIDNLNFIKQGLLSDVMKVATVKIGHMEVNYGDTHFRRSDNSAAIYNPFVGNTIIDAFTTEVAGEVYVQTNGWLGMVGLSNGKLNQAVNNPKTTSPSVYAKVGYDKQLNEDVRVRLTGSIYNTAQARGTYLYDGDRAGSRYYLVLEDADASSASNFRSGRYNPGFEYELNAIMINPFVKFQGLEIFGMYEMSTGKSAGEIDKRDWTQYLVEVLYRFGNNENFYVGGRYNNANGEERGTGNDVTIDRFNVGVGAFITKNILAKLEYVSQSYDGFNVGNILNEGKFDGVVFESVISF